MSDTPFIIDNSSDAQGTSSDPNMIAIYITELGETVTNIEKTLIELEKDFTNKDKINTVFRLFHNLKGSSAMMGFSNLKDLCHFSESLLDKIRSGLLDIQSSYIDLFMEALGAVRLISENISNTNSEGKERNFFLLHKLEQASNSAHVSAASKEDHLEKLENPESADSHQKHAENEVIKVNREQIETLMLLVGEYISLKNRAIWLNRLYPGDRKFSDLTQELEIFAQKFQRNVLKLRLSSVVSVFDSMRRVVRTTAKKLGKKVDFDIEGSDTLLDRMILDVIAEPLMHMIRNSIDHGIEDPETRIEHNKSETGRLLLKADYSGGEVHISVTDDGNGMDTERIKKKCLEIGLLGETQLAALSKQEIIQLIFLPGFSSVDKVTETSGRGVGMDVVKSTVQMVGGEIDVATELGVGSSITLRLPLSMSIVDSLSFEVAGQAYSIPQLNVEEVYSLHSYAVRENLKELPGTGKTLNVRGSPIPVINLANVLTATGADIESLIQIRQGKRRFVIEVGKILGPTSIVTQPLPNQYAEDAPFSGITTRGDGSLLFQLDIEKIAKHIQNFTVTRRKSNSINRGTAGIQQEGGLLSSSDIRRLQQKIITFSCQQHFCIPVQRAKRIVFLRAAEIKTLGGNCEEGHSHYITLEGETIMLLWLEKLLLSSPPTIAENYSLILFQHAGNTYGIPTADFRGIKRMPESYETTLAEPGILGSTVIDSQTLLLLDLGSLVQLESRQKLEVKAPEKEVLTPKKILAAEDDRFFASELLSTLRGNGYDVIIVDDGLAAKNALSDESFVKSLYAVVTDLEMPNMTGLQLIRWMKGNEKTKDLPVIAYTAISTQEMMRKTMQLGATDFISKMSFEPLLKSLAAIKTGHSMDSSLLEAGHTESASERVISFHLGSNLFALPMRCIKEVSPLTSNAQVPYAPTWCNQLTFFRGHSIPVMNLGAFFNIPFENNRTQEQVVVECEGKTFAIIVDRICEVILESLMQQGEGFPSHTEIEQMISPHVKHIYTYHNNIIIMLNEERLNNAIFIKQQNSLEKST